MKAYAYVSLLDQGRPLPPKAEREVSHHNPYHGKNFARMSRLIKDHPEYNLQDREGNKHWGVVCLGYPEVREYMINRYLSVLEGYDWDGVFVCLRTQSRPADYADQYGFNEPIRMEFRRRHGRDILHQEFDLQDWRDLQGSYLTTFLRELRTALRKQNLNLAVGCARGDIIGPPIGNATLEWRKWLNEKIVDELVIDQSSVQRPSLWIQLWPMHRGHGYLQNYIDDWNLLPLEEDLSRNYTPAIENTDANLYVAWQWKERDPESETFVLAQPEVTGLAYSAFRHDNPGPIARDDWRV